MREHGTGAALFGYTKLYGQVPGGQAEFLRVPQAQYGPIKVPEGPPDDRFLFLSDVLPTAWQAVEYADIPDGGSVAVLGLGPIGDMACRIAQHRGADRVIGVDLVPERLERARRARRRGRSTSTTHDDLAAAIRELTDGRGPDAVIDAVGMEAHGSPPARSPSSWPGCCPTRVAEKLMETAGIDRLARAAPGHRHRPPRRHDLAQRRLRRHGRPDADAADVRQADHAADGPGQRQALGRRPPAAASPTTTTRSASTRFATHHLPLDEAPDAYETFQKKEDGAIKIVFSP